jgi:hypothetical protein
MKGFLTYNPECVYLSNEFDFVVKVFRAYAGAGVDEEDEVNLAVLSEPRDSRFEDSTETIHFGTRTTIVAEF